MYDMDRDQHWFENDSGGDRSVSKRIISFSYGNEHREVSMLTNMQGHPDTTLCIPRSGRYIVSAPPLEKKKATFSRRVSRSVGYAEVSARMAVTAHQVEVKSVYLQSELFHHFNYILNLARDCEPRVRKIYESMEANELLNRDVFIRIRYVGKMNDDIPLQKTIKNGKTIWPSDQVEWETSPLVCFQNDLSLALAIQLLRGVEKGPKILITSDSIAGDSDRKADDIILVDQDHFLKELTQCLEGPLCEMLHKWIKNIEALTLTKKNQWVIEEIKTIREEMAFQEISTEPKNPGIVPCNIKTHLLGRDDVNSFGIWYNSSFKVFTKKGSDNHKLHKELIALNSDFFQKYSLKIETKEIVVKLSLMQGDGILPEAPNEKGNYEMGTLGGFATKANDHRKYALTCGHIFPTKNLPAFAADSLQFKQIGKSMFSTGKQILCHSKANEISESEEEVYYCDFAVIEIDESVSKDCDVTFRRDDETETNARVHEGSINDLKGFAYKIGARTKKTKGKIISAEHYFNNNPITNFVFFVKGFGEPFSKDGDSGSLVFSRPRNVSHNFVNVIGMVCGHDATFEEEKEESLEKEVFYPCGADNLKESEGRGGKSVFSPKESLDDVDSNDTEPTGISMCCYIGPALDLFKHETGETLKFKDDLPTSPLQ